MKLENQVCTLEQGVYFEENGLNLESHFVWVEHQDQWGNEYKIWERKFIENHTKKSPTDYYCPAYSCAELGVLLPKYLQLGNWINDVWYPEKWLAVNRHDMECTLFMRYDEGFICGYMEYDSYSEAREFLQKNQYEAHAKADLLIHLLKEKIIKPEDLSLEDK